MIICSISVPSLLRGSNCLSEAKGILIFSSSKIILMRKLLFIQFFLLSFYFLNAQQNPIVIKGALIYTAAGAPIPNGILIVQNGKITAVGNSSLSIPANAQII